MNIYFVTDKDDPQTGLFATLAKQFGGELIDFYTMDLDKLSIIARYRILPVPTILVTNGNKTLLRLVRPRNQAFIIDVLSALLPTRIEEVNVKTDE